MSEARVRALCRLAILLALLGGAVLSGAADRPAAIQQVVVVRDGKQVQVHVGLNRLVRPRVTTDAGPHRIVLDFPNTTAQVHQRQIVVEENGVRSVRIGSNQSSPALTRVVVDLSQAEHYRIITLKDAVVLIITNRDSAAAANLQAARKAETPRLVAPAPATGAVPATAKHPAGPEVAGKAAAVAAPSVTQAMPAPQKAATGASTPAAVSVSATAATSPATYAGAANVAPAAPSPVQAASLSQPPGTTAVASAFPGGSHAAPGGATATAVAPGAANAAPDQPALAAAANSDLRTVFRVKYVAQGAAYLDGGRAAGLAEGVKLVIKDSGASTSAPAQDAGIVAQLQVASVAQSSAVCEIRSAAREVRPGDLAYLTDEDTAALVQQRALSATRLYPQVITFSEGDPLDEEAREEVPRPPLPEVNRARGRIGFDYGGINSRGASFASSSQFGLVLRTDITRIGGSYWNMSGYWRGRLDSRSSAGQPTLQDMINRTYHLGLTYDNPQSRWVAGFGRLYLPWATSLDTIDGGYVGRRIARSTTAGLFAGSTPDPTSWSYNPDRRMAGTFINFEGGSFDSFRYTSTSGVALSTLLWRIERPFIFFENGIFYKRYLSIYHSLQADRPAATSQVPNPGAGIGRSFLTVRLQPLERFSFDVNHNYFRDVPTFSLKLVGTGLLDKVLFQGVSVGARAEVVRKIFLYTEQGRSTRSGDTRSSWNQMYGITLADLWRTGLRADGHYSKFNSSFAQGSYRSLSLSRNVGENLRLEVQAGRQSFVSPFTTDTGSRFLNMSLDSNLGVRYFVQGGYTLERGAIQNYDQWYVTLGYRFDNRSKPK